MSLTFTCHILLILPTLYEENRISLWFSLFHYLYCLTKVLNCYFNSLRSLNLGKQSMCYIFLWIHLNINEGKATTNPNNRTSLGNEYQVSKWWPLLLNDFQMGGRNNADLFSHTRNSNQLLWIKFITLRRCRALTSNAQLTNYSGGHQSKWVLTWVILAYYITKKNVSLSLHSCISIAEICCISHRNNNRPSTPQLGHSISGHIVGCKGCWQHQLLLKWVQEKETLSWQVGRKHCSKISNSYFNIYFRIFDSIELI